MVELEFHPTISPFSFFSIHWPLLTHQYLLSAYLIPEPGVGTRAKDVSKTELDSALMEFTFYWGGLGRTHVKKIFKYRI